PERSRWLYPPFPTNGKWRMMDAACMVVRLSRREGVMHRSGLTAIAFMLTVAGSACARPGQDTTGLGRPDAGSAAPASRGHTRITIATFREMDFLPNNSFPGSPDVRTLVNPGLSVLDPSGAQQPLLT